MGNEKKIKYVINNFEMDYFINLIDTLGVGLTACAGT